MKKNKYFNIILIWFVLFVSISNVKAAIIDLTDCFNSPTDIFTGKGVDTMYMKKFEWSKKNFDLYNTKYISKKEKRKDGKPLSYSNGLRFLEDKNFYKEINDPEKYYKIKELEKNSYSINTTNSTITHLKVYTDDHVKFITENFSSTADLAPLTYRKFNSYPYKILSYADNTVIATYANPNLSHRSEVTYRMYIDLKNMSIHEKATTEFGTMRYADDNMKVCSNQSKLSGNDYTKYWWAAVLIAAVIFFIYTQTKSEIGDSNKKEKSNLLKSFFVFCKKKMVRKNKIIIKEKKIEQKKPLKSENLLIKFLEGKESLAYSFWFMYSVLTTLNEIIRYILRANDLLFAAGLYFVFQWCYFIFATIGTWKSATNYKINKVSKNEGAGWATAVYVYLAISLASSIFRTIKSLG